MLNFFTRYQRLFFITIGSLVIISFVFFGAYDRSSSPVTTYEDKVIGKLINGKDLNEMDLKMFSLFINSSAKTASFDKSYVNVFNDGVVTEDFLKTNLAHLLVKEYFNKLKPAFEERFEKIKRYSPYQHPQAPFLSARAMWEHFSPSISENLEKISEKKEVDEEFFTILVDLYLAQIEFPSDYLRRVLSYHQSQYSWLKPDPRLYDEDMSLFGFHSLSDWFGPEFLDLLSNFTLNVAEYAKEKGYAVSYSEAKEKMLFNVAQINTEEPIDYRKALQFLGFREKSAVNIWQNILLFRRVFNDLTESVFLDDAPFDSFASFASEKANLELYKMQKPLVIKEFTDLLRFQLYVGGLAGVSRTELSLPEKIYPLEKISKDSPDLIKNKYTVKIAHIDLEEKARSISLAQMQQWQLEEKNWMTLTGKFPALKYLKTEEERFSALEYLDSKTREQVDAFSRLQIFLDTPNYIENELSSLEKEERTIEIFANHQTNFSLIKDGEKFQKFLDKASAESMYKQGNQYFSVKVENHLKEILTFEEALKNGALDRILDIVLETEYKKLKNLSPQNFKDEKGEFKPLPEVRDLVGVYAFASLLREIDKDYQNVHKELSWVQGMGPKEFYCKHRFAKHLREQRAKVLSKDLTCVFDKAQDRLLDQWKLVKSFREVSKSENLPINNLVFSEELDELSFVTEFDDTTCFFRLSEKSVDHQAKELQKQKAKKALSLAMKKELAERLIKEIQEKSATMIVADLVK